MSLDTNSNILIDLKVSDYVKAISHYNDFDVNRYLSQFSCIAITTAKNSFKNKITVLNLTIKFQIHIFKNLIIILLEHVFYPVYYFNEHDLFGVITDKNFNIIAFVINKIPAITISYLKHSFEQRNLLEESAFPLYDCETKIMKNKNCLIKKIFELENVNQWEIIYYGLQRSLIDKQFIMDYCYALIEQKNSTDQFVLDIAALTDKDDLYKLDTRTNAKISNHDEVLITKGQQYNKIWFYLSLATDLCAEKIIK